MENSKSKFDFLVEVECVAAFLPCVAEALDLLHEELEQNAVLCSKRYKNMGGFRRISNAMVPALHELNRLQMDLNAAIQTAYEQKKENAS